MDNHTFFFFSIFILSPCCQRDTLLYVHVPFRWERKSPSSRPCHCSQIIRTAITVYNVQLYQDKLLLVGSCLVTLISICMSHMMKNQTKQAGWVITNSVKKKVIVNFGFLQLFTKKYLTQPNCLAFSFSLLKIKVEKKIKAIYCTEIFFLLS